MGASVRNHTESKMAKLLLLLLHSLILADGPGGHHGHHHGGHHGDHGAHHGAHNEHHPHGAHSEDHAHPGGAQHHGDHGVSHHPVQHTVVQSSPVQHHTVHSSVQRPVSASFSIQPETAHPIQHSVPRGPQDLAQLIATHPKLTTLSAAVKAAGLESTLASPGPFTVFAPTDLAFKKIPDADLQRLLGDKAALSKILLRHVVPGTKMQGKNIPPGVTNLKTAAGEQISATRDKFIQVKSKEGSAFIVLFDVIASNGVLHAVDTVF